MNIIDQLEPKNVLHWFQEISNIPRCSGDEKRISDYLVEFAKERGLEHYQDDALNVIIKKKATAGYESSEPVIIQGHMDMVCVNGPGSNHDFSTDPIQLLVDGDTLHANNTTLGADDGIAVAYGLALLDSNQYNHPALELLITTNEETGMDGAMALSGEHLQGKTLLNIDSEDEGIFLVSCAGGIHQEIHFPIERELVTKQGLKISITGLKGGHSGVEIVKQRGNALKIMGRLLDSADINDDITIGSFVSGLKHNSVPNYADATISTSNLEESKQAILHMAEKIKVENQVEDPGFTVTVEEINLSQSYTHNLSRSLLNFLIAVPNGVQYMSKDIEGLVQTSLNVAIIGEKEGKIIITISIRSSLKSNVDEIVRVNQVLATLCGATSKTSKGYPSWEYQRNSPIKEKCMEVYRNLFDKEAKVSAIHAGLECGLFKTILPDVDMISFGPNIQGAHSEKERMSLSSAGRMWEFLIKLLESMK